MTTDRELLEKIVGELNLGNHELLFIALLQQAQEDPRAVLDALTTGQRDAFLAWVGQAAFAEELYDPWERFESVAALRRVLADVLEAAGEPRPHPPTGEAMSRYTLLTPEALAAALLDLPGFRIEGGQLAIDLKFRDFAKAFAFMTEVAAAAERLDHHPEWSNAYNRVSVRLITHDRDAITDLDVALAREVLAALAHGGKVVEPPPAGSPSP